MRKHRIIHPFSERFLEGDSYVLTVKEDVILNYLEHRNLVSKEIVMLPMNVIGILTAKSRFGRMGLCFLSAAKVHSGFVGRLVLEVVNLNDTREPIVIKSGDPFMHIVFMERVGKPDPYKGEYQFQHMSQEEIEEAKVYLEKMLSEP